MKPTIARICSEVAYRFGLSVADLTGPSRRQAVARPRQLAMLLASELTTRSFPEIGHAFGGRDHTTIIHGVRTMRALVEREPDLADQYRAVREAISPTPAALLTAPRAQPQGDQP